MLNLFKKNKGLKVLSPVDGVVLDLKDVPDPTFSEKIVGDGIGIIPSSGEFSSPVDAVVEVLPKQGHAFGLVAKDGIEILVHIGLETVTLDGEGFDVLVSQDSSVLAGAPMINVDLDSVKSKVNSMATPIICSNMDSISQLKILVKAGDTVKKGDAIFEVFK